MSKTLAAYCSSYACTSKEDAAKLVRKLVNRDTDECPACGHFLFWKVFKEGEAPMYSFADNRGRKKSATHNKSVRE